MSEQKNAIDKVNKEIATSTFGSSTATRSWAKNISGESLFVTTLSIEHFVYPSNCSLFLFRIERGQEFVEVRMEEFKPTKNNTHPPEHPEDKVNFDHTMGGYYPLSMAVEGDFSMLSEKDEVVLLNIDTYNLQLFFHVSRLTFPGDITIFTGGSVVGTF